MRGNLVNQDSNNHLIFVTSNNIFMIPAHTNNKFWSVLKCLVKVYQTREKMQHCNDVIHVLE